MFKADPASIWTPREYVCFQATLRLGTSVLVNTYCSLGKIQQKIKHESFLTTKNRAVYNGL